MMPILRVACSVIDSLLVIRYLYPMYNRYPYPSPSARPARYESKWHLGWNACLLFLANLMFLALYAIEPGVSLRVLLTVITVVATLGILSATLSIFAGEFWLSQIYAACGLIGNISVLLWLLLFL
jgi:hypothetical protein